MGGGKTHDARRVGVEVLVMQRPVTATAGPINHELHRHAVGQ